MGIEIKVLGAGQMIGKSCFLVTLGEPPLRVMLDCGIKVEAKEFWERYPSFGDIYGNSGGVAASHGDDSMGSSMSSRNNGRTTLSLTSFVDVVAVTHFHLDHIGALPYLTERLGYDGPVLMTCPTKALAPPLLVDNAVQTMRRKEQEKADGVYDEASVLRSIAKAKTLNLQESYTIRSGATITPYYAGHVLGAVMFHVKVGSDSILYTGDYTMVTDPHLGPARVPRLFPDVVITECTYGSAFHSSKQKNTTDLMRSIHGALTKGGIVLVPTVAVGRTHELLYSVLHYWRRHKLNFPVYSAGGITNQVGRFYSLFRSWTNARVSHSAYEVFGIGNAVGISPATSESSFGMDEFLHDCTVPPFRSEWLQNPLEGPMLIFAPPHNISKGLSLNILMHICGSPKNLVVLTHYNSPGSISEKLTNGEKSITVGDKILRVNCTVRQTPYSSHADARGIIRLISRVEPQSVVLVHGDKPGMDFLRAKIHDEIPRPVYIPCNGSILKIPTSREQPQPIYLSHSFMRFQDESPFRLPVVAVDSDEDAQQPSSYREKNDGYKSVRSLVVHCHGSRSVTSFPQGFTMLDLSSPLLRRLSRRGCMHPADEEDKSREPEIVASLPFHAIWFKRRFRINLKSFIRIWRNLQGENEFSTLTQTLEKEDLPFSCSLGEDGDEGSVEYDGEIAVLRWPIQEDDNPGSPLPLLRKMLDKIIEDKQGSRKLERKQE